MFSSQAQNLGKVCEGVCVCVCEGGWLVVANFLISDPVFLRLSHGEVMIFLQITTKTNAILFYDKKGQGPKAQLSPFEVQAVAKQRRGLCAGQSPCPGSTCPVPGLGSPAGARAWLKAWSQLAGRSGPGPQTLPSLIPEAGRSPRHSPSSGFLFTPERISCMGSIGTHVANTSQVSSQLPAPSRCLS